MRQANDGCQGRLQEGDRLAWGTCDACLPPGWDLNTEDTVSLCTWSTLLF